MEYPQLAGGTILPLDGAVRNETWMIQSSMGKWVLKRYKVGLAFDQILHEHSVLLHLEGVGFPAPRLVRAHDGQTLAQVNGRNYAVFGFLEGYFQFQRYQFFPSQTTRFLSNEGQTLADLHLTLQNCTPKGRNLAGFQSVDGPRWQDLDWYLGRLHAARELASQRAREDHPPVSWKMLERADWFEEQLQEAETMILQKGLPRQIIHGDFGPYNLMFRPGQPTAVLDFELSRLDWRVIDVISALATSCWQENLEACWENTKPVLDGYLAINPLSPVEKDLLPVVWRFLSLRRMIICWERYLQNDEVARLGEIKKRFHRLQWIERNREALASLYD
jgi:homoserine kinase type II